MRSVSRGCCTGHVFRLATVSFGLLMKQNIARWNERYARGNPNPDFHPDPLLKRYRWLLQGKGKALDVACGVGHNALFLASLGYEVVAVDGSLAGLAHCRERLRDATLPVALVAADLDRFFPPAHYFDMLLVVRYLDRRSLSRWTAALRTGGLFIYKTFNRNVLREKPHFPADYVLELGELSHRFEDFRLVATNECSTMLDTESYWIGYKP